MSRIAVIGAGPAGLWAARRAVQRGHDVVVHERGARPGGMAASFEVDGVRVDHGSHRLHPATDDEILREIDALLHGTLQWRPRNGRIRLLDRWVRFPLSPIDLARNLPPRFAAAAIGDALVPRRERADTYAEVVRAGLGPAMLEHFYGPYARKLWGEEPERLAGHQARTRISASTPLAMVRKLAVRQRPHFWYPRDGFGAIVDALVPEAGDVRCGSEVTSLDELDADHIWSTIPLPVLARLAGDTTDHGLRFRSLVLVHVVVPTRPWTPFDAHYLPGPETALTRLTEVQNYRSSAADPLDRTVLCAELPCAIGDAHWSMSDDALGALVARDIEALGLPPIEVSQVHVTRQPAAYPIYDLGFEAKLARLEAMTSALPRVTSFGRGGLFAHDNTHHALAEGDAAAACLRDDGSWDDVRWAMERARFRGHVVED
ncbi:MAG TPA: FAD-dependent oxidoreductase [Acidimicrobiales bacterium]|nr:FAD-dependent oxidoreductase [Acidimicrobiales bacterium]